mmetsp:Transcript_128946/g.321643  ORF Transcript_128946/g.321643 Transcript_128946/m.321643 type:complete len:227 (-) Transcript_128946:998-1678(-)
MSHAAAEHCPSAPRRGTGRDEQSSARPNLPGGVQLNATAAAADRWVPAASPRSCLQLKRSRPKVWVSGAKIGQPVSAAENAHLAVHLLPSRPQMHGDPWTCRRAKMPEPHCLQALTAETGGGAGAVWLAALRGCPASSHRGRRGRILLYCGCCSHPSSAAGSSNASLTSHLLHNCLRSSREMSCHWHGTSRTPSAPGAASPTPSMPLLMCHAQFQSKPTLHSRLAP